MLKTSYHSLKTSKAAMQSKTAVYIYIARIDASCTEVCHGPYHAGPLASFSVASNIENWERGPAGNEAMLHALTMC